MMSEQNRYLQYIEDTRISHLERIRGFVTRKFKGITRVTADVKEAFANSLSFLNFSLLEASACLDFADGLFYVGVPPRLYLLSTQSVRLTLSLAYSSTRLSCVYH